MQQNSTPALCDCVMALGSPDHPQGKLGSMPWGSCDQPGLVVTAFNATGQYGPSSSVEGGN